MFNCPISTNVESKSVEFRGVGFVCPTSSLFTLCCEIAQDPAVIIKEHSDIVSWVTFLMVLNKLDVGILRIRDHINDVVLHTLYYIDEVTYDVNCYCFDRFALRK